MTEKEVTIENFLQYLSTPGSLDVVIGKSTLGGRGLFATKFIKKGTLIFCNKPTVYGPRGNCDVKFCSSCYQISELCYPCGKCNAFICSENCQSLSDHAQLCTFIRENWTLKNDATEEESIIVARILFHLRFMLLSEKHKDMLRLFQKSKSIGKFEELEMLQSKYVIPEKHIEFIKTVESVIKINSFRISHRPGSGKVELRGFYPLSAFQNHSCVPNSRNVFKENLSKAVYATKDIENGEEITSCYTGLLWCSPARRCQLYKTKNFWCQCTRCSDETEMGTKLSALKCINKSCIGILLPKNPLDAQTEWYCDTCNILIAAEKINMIQSVLGSLVGTLKLDDEFRMDHAILKRLAMFIPYSNHIFVDIRLRLALRLGFANSDVIKGIIKRKTLIA